MKTKSITRYILTLIKDQEEEIISSFRVKKLAEETKKKLKNKNKKNNYYVNKVVFTGRELINYIDEVKFTASIAGQFIYKNKHYLFDVSDLEYSYEVGMAIDYINKNNLHYFLDIHTPKKYVIKQCEKENCLYCGKETKLADWV